MLELIDGLDDGRAAMPSALSGWTRGHVVRHLTDNARTFERQARFALRGEPVEMYDGGREGHDRSIERGASRPLARLREDLRSAQLSPERTWAPLTAEDWRRPVRFRHATVLDPAD